MNIKKVAQQKKMPLTHKNKNTSIETCHRTWMSDSFQSGLVSVIIPTYNRANFILNSVKSVFDQDYRPIELLVINDGSTDNTLDILECWQKQHTHDNHFSLQIYSQPNQGAQVARNLGLIKSSGEFIQFLDSDDFLAPDKISCAVKIMMNDHEVDMVYSMMQELDAQTGEYHPWSNESGFTDLDKYTLLSERIIRPLWTASPIYRRSVVVQTGPWNEKLSCQQDVEFNARAIVHVKKHKKIARPQAFFRQHTGKRVSISLWGDKKGIISLVLTIRSMYELLNIAPDAKSILAYRTLANRCLSCIRVGVASGHILLTRDIIANNKDILKQKPCGLFEARIWKLISILPGSFTRMTLKPLALLKNRIKNFNTIRKN